MIGPPNIWASSVPRSVSVVREFRVRSETTSSPGCNPETSLAVAELPPSADPPESCAGPPAGHTAKATTATTTHRPPTGQPSAARQARKTPRRSTSCSLTRKARHRIAQHRPSRTTPQRNDLPPPPHQLRRIRQSYPTQTRKATTQTFLAHSRSFVVCRSVALPAISRVRLSRVTRALIVTSGASWTSSPGRAPTHVVRPVACRSPCDGDGTSGTPPWTPSGYRSSASTRVP